MTGGGRHVDVVIAHGNYRGMVRIPPHQRLGHNSNLADVVGVADVIHVTLGGWKPCAVLRDDIDARVRSMQPDGRGQTRNVKNDPDAIGLHLVHDPVEPLKGELALRWLKRIPRQVAHAHDIETRALHDGNVLIDLLR